MRILVDDEHVDAIEDVAAALQEAGLRLDLSLPMSGVITGAVEDEAAITAIGAVEGVEKVELPREIQLPPPDEPIQ